METPQAIAIRNRIIGVLVKRTRLRMGKSQRECAEFLGCSSSMFRKYEHGERGLSLSRLEALAYLFDVPPASLWDEEHPLPNDPAEEALPMEELMLLRRKILAVQFRQCRHTAGLTQREMGELLGCSASTISGYERAKRDIPLAELELAAKHCGQGLDDFLDDQTIPLGPAEQDRQALACLSELPPDVREFVLRPTNLLYFRVAMLLSSLKADSLRRIAEILLDITY
ncbi:MAG: helix-turn-helix transcriptional regulator [Anaerolineae bacterium]|jgi:transcriptional regulator with XRE-family HTH domain